VKAIVRMFLGIAVVATVVRRGQKARQVYVEEVSAGSRPIQAVGTAIAAFIGVAPKHPDSPSSDQPSRLP